MKNEGCKRVLMVWAFALVLVLVLGLTGCGNSSQDSGSQSSSENSSQTEQVSSQSEGKEELSSLQAATGGSPWVNSCEGGNLPIEQPEVKDDLYLYTNYDYIADHQMSGGNTLVDAQPEIVNSVTRAIEDASKSSPELNQLRIFYNQAADLDARAKTGLSEVKPYYDRIQAVSSIDELNELLASDDFPFVPFVDAYIGTIDMREHNIVAVYPKFVFSNGVLGGAEYYQNTDDPNVKNYNEMVLAPETLKAQCVFKMYGFSEEEASELTSSCLSLEGSYGKYADYNSKLLKQEYGACVHANQNYTMDELQALCPQVPIRELLAKAGKDGSDTYAVLSSTWMGELNKLWTNNNLDGLKKLVALSMMKDCQPIIDPNLYESYYTSQHQAVPDAKTSAYESCNTIDTFSTVIGKTYAYDILGNKAKDRLLRLTHDLIDSYKELFNSTKWMGDEAKRKAIEKLDHMTLNVLEPDGGYYDYGKLSLTPTEEGGTMLGNLLAIKRYRSDCDRQLIDQPAKAMSSWCFVRATEMNCFYDPSNNSINIMPGFVTSAVYTDSMSEQELLAVIGTVIGHEISHGFDYLGSQYNAYGTPNPIFTDDVAKAFVDRCQKLVDYFNTIQISDGVYMNGANKRTEGVADLCGLQVSLEHAKKLGSVDYAKFFQDNARYWCQVSPPGTSLALSAGTHPLNYLRTNVNAQMFDEFYDAFGVTNGNGMYLAPDKRVVMWGPNA